MEELTQAKQIISDAKNICIIPSQHEPESLSAALALFYTLKDLGKNVNLIVDEFPEKLHFLIPSLDFISSPKNFVLSIPKSVADVSQIYYEKTEENLKIHLTVDTGRIRKENISFYLQEPKPDLAITLRIPDFRSHLEHSLDSYGFLLDSPLINIDVAESENKKFGRVNIIEDKSSSEIVLALIKSLHENLLPSSETPSLETTPLVQKNVANCILTGLIIYYENFKSKKIRPEIFEITAQLIKNGASHQEIIKNLENVGKAESKFLEEILKNSHTENGEISSALLTSDEFLNFDELEAHLAVEKIRMIGNTRDMLVLWQSHASGPIIKGFFYSKKEEAVAKVATYQNAASKKDWVFLLIPESDMVVAKEKILKNL